ncbi:MAG: prepilin peptidase [Pseudomonadota bacterium]
MALLPLLLLAPLLVAVAWFDLRYLRIPNWLVVAALLLYVVTVPLIGFEEAGLRLLAAFIVLAVGTVSFAFRLFGGGDVKMLAALVLFVPSQSYVLFGYTFAVSILLGISLIMTMRRTPFVRDLNLASLKAIGAFPMGISISAAGLALPFFLNALA